MENKNLFIGVNVEGTMAAGYNNILSIEAETGEVLLHKDKSGCTVFVGTKEIIEALLVYHNFDENDYKAVPFEWLEQNNKKTKRQPTAFIEITNVIQFDINKYREV